MVPFAIERIVVEVNFWLNVADPPAAEYPAPQLLATPRSTTGRAVWGRTDRRALIVVVLPATMAPSRPKNLAVSESSSVSLRRPSKVPERRSGLRASNGELELVGGRTAWGLGDKGSAAAPGLAALAITTTFFKCGSAAGKLTAERLNLLLRNPALAPGLPRGASFTQQIESDRQSLHVNDRAPRSSGSAPPPGRAPRSSPRSQAQLRFSSSRAAQALGGALLHKGDRGSARPPPRSRVGHHDR